MKTPIVRKSVVILTLSAVLLGGCSSKINPFNWFGKREKVETLAPLDDPSVIIDQRGLVDQVISLKVEKVGGGAIIHVVGLPQTQGFWEAELVAENLENAVNGVLTYQFRIAPPPGFAKVSTQQSREVVVGHFVSSHKLAGVRSIRVVGARNARSVRR